MAKSSKTSIIPAGTRFKVIGVLYIEEYNIARIRHCDGELLPLNCILKSKKDSRPGWSIIIGPGDAITQAAFEKMGSDYFECGATFIMFKGEDGMLKPQALLQQLSSESELLVHLRELTR